ncbi:MULTISPECIES: 23S ribosomal RNA methyltransferase Erm [Microbacterium]|jgi:23S rRNA (adenine-N6)-dimethyltransferase|uniref:23S ribosomal RNA methyltransferase Erm n=1 Tax=Microbacterium TaxID=33882 RepID=UPI001D1754C0|nr:23S ribosomal RNA methyltransferase Erm [Microbacterium testaceum]MCC4249763.1 23S ribosomal RNA methyltransferase Erm [Microbacterium testaceum]
MRTRSVHGGRHELGQNFLIHQPTIDRIVALVATTEGAILEIGAGGGALTTGLAGLGRGLTAIDIDERRIAALRRAHAGVHVEHADALRHPLDAPVIAGNIPFHLTTPILRRLLQRPGWRDAVLLTQWEVARKRAGVGGGTLMTAQAAPWFAFTLHGRVPSHAFRPAPSVDGGILSITRRGSPLVPLAHRRAYERFVGEVFTAKGRGMGSILATVRRCSRPAAKRHLTQAGVGADALPRDLGPQQWADLWKHLMGGQD